jgi:hypothetical protein
VIRGFTPTTIEVSQLPGGLGSVNLVSVVVGGNRVAFNRSCFALPVSASRSRSSFDGDLFMPGPVPPTTMIQVLADDDVLSGFFNAQTSTFDIEFARVITSTDTILFIEVEDSGNQ